MKKTQKQSQRERITESRKASQKESFRVGGVRVEMCRSTRRVLDENNGPIMLGSAAHGSRRFMRCLTRIYCASCASKPFEIVFFMARVSPRLGVDTLWLWWSV